MGRERKLPPFPWLVAFEVAARLKSFGLAAKALSTSQPAISQRVANLEAMLSVTLFRRTSRGVDLTPEGAALLADLTEGLSLIERAIERLRQPAARNFTISTDHGFAAFWLIPRLPSLQADLPSTNVRVVTSQATFDIRGEPADVAIVFGSGRWAGCVADLLVRETVLPVCAPGFLASVPSAQLGELEHLPLLHLESNAETQWLDWAGWFGHLGLRFSPHEKHTTINNYGLVMQAALAGQGAALAWRPLVDDLLERGQLVPVVDETVVTDKGYYVVHRPGGISERTVTRFRAWLRAELAR